MIRLEARREERVHDVLPSAVPRLVHNSTIIGSLFRAAYSREIDTNSTPFLMQHSEFGWSTEKLEVGVGR